MRIVVAALPREIGARHRAHDSCGCQQKHRVGFGQTRFDPEQDRAAHDQTGKQRAAPGHKGERGPVCQQHGANRADQRRNAIQPDTHLRARQAELGCGLHDGSLRPVNADGLFVSHLVLETDIDEIAGFDHLLGGLREAGFVAVDRRNVEESGQEKQQADQDQQ